MKFLVRHTCKTYFYIRFFTSLSRKYSSQIKGEQTPLKRLLNEATSYGEANLSEPELQWATQPYATEPTNLDTTELEDPQDTTVILFPGQGTHTVGMGLRLVDVPAAKELYELASSVVGISVQDDGTGENTLSATQRARLERQRLRARLLRESRLARPDSNIPVPTPAPAPLSGGGFLCEDEPPAPLLRVAPSAPLLAGERPFCIECGVAFPQSFLFDTFGHRVCDTCRDDDDRHALVTRTDAKAAYLLRDADLDTRDPPLPALRRRNPHRGGHDMRLYLRPQLEERALLVWGSEEALADERDRRELRKDRARETATRRRLRELRLAAGLRSTRAGADAKDSHRHEYGPESYDAAADEYSRRCGCGHVLVYEKM